jgi:hypothetical protein
MLGSHPTIPPGFVTNPEAWIAGGGGSTRVGVRDHFWRAIEQKQMWVIWLKMDPLYDALRASPRFFSVKWVCQPDVEESERWPKSR